jgi:hypothetical protein
VCFAAILIVYTMRIAVTSCWSTISVPQVSVSNDHLPCFIQISILALININNNAIRNTLYTIKRKKAKWIAHILRRNRSLKHVIEG